MSESGSTHRLTRYQEQILATLERLDAPISAQDLHAYLRQAQPRLGLATVYRGLEILKMKGLVQSRAAVTGEALYSRVEQDQHYLTCLQCGTSTPLTLCPIQEMANQMQQSRSFKVYYHTLEFFGLCLPCWEQQEAKS
jgi:Fur family transcriptional regulator, ferric uptake regulator